MQRVRLPLALEGLRVDGDRLFRLRTGKGITQLVVAERAEISERWDRCIERLGQQPSRPVAESIAAALDCELSDFCSTVTPEAA